MRMVLKSVALLSLAALVLPPILFLAALLELDTTKWLMLVATIVWFAAAAPSMWTETA